MFAVSFKLKDGGRRHREFDITIYTVSSFETVYMASDARFVYYKYCAYIGYALCYDSALLGCSGEARTSLCTERWISLILWDSSRSSAIGASVGLVRRRVGQRQPLGRVGG